MSREPARGSEVAPPRTPEIARAAGLVQEAASLRMWLVVVRVQAVLALVVGSGVAVSWSFGWTGPLTVLPALPAMKFDTAIALATAGAGLLASTLRARTGRGARAANAMAWLAIALTIALSSLALIEWLGGFDAGIEADWSATSTSLAPGRMSPAPAVSLLLIAVGQAALAVRAARARVSHPSLLAVWSSRGAVAICILGLLHLLARSFGREEILYIASMAVHTAWILTLLGSAVVLLESLERRRADTPELPDALTTSIGRIPALTGWSALAILVVGAGITFVVASRVERDAAEVARARLERLTERLVAETRRRVELPLHGLKGARGVFDIGARVDRAEFRAYVASRDLPVEYPGAVGFGFIVHVLRPELDAFVAAERADGAPEFSLRTSGEPQDLWVIELIEPLESNASTLGYDVGSVPLIRTAIESASRTGQPALTAPVSLLHDRDERPAFVYLLPVYAKGTHPSTEVERVRDLVGILYAPLVIEEIFADVTAVADRALCFEVFDDAFDPTSPMYASDPLTPERGARPGDQPLSVESRIEIGGRSWRVRATANPEHMSPGQNTRISTAMVIGLLLTSFVAALAWAYGRGHARAAGLAHAMTLEMHEAGALRTAILEYAAHGIIATATDGVVTHCNAAAARMLGRRAEDVVGVARIEELVDGDSLARLAEACAQRLAIAAPSGFEALTIDARRAGSSRFESVLVSADGIRFPVELVVTSLHDDRGELNGFLTIAIDISERLAVQEHLEHTARTDALTGLSNRTLFLDRVGQALKRRGRDPSRHCAVLFLDFDRFKLVNDTLGHAAGDQLLVQIADRLRALLRTTDSITVEAGESTAARMGGDEFVVLVEDLAAPADADIVAARMLQAFAEPYDLGGDSLTSTVSIGIAVAVGAQESASQLVRDADLAMYAAKRAGRARAVRFDPAMRPSAAGDDAEEVRRPDRAAESGR